MRALLALCVLALAGCASDAGHGGHDTLEVIVGVKNVGAQAAAFTLVVEGPAGSGPMREQVGAKPNETVERRFVITNEGGHRALVEWPRGMAMEAWTTDECTSFHIVFHVDASRTGEVTPDRTRECH